MTRTIISIINYCFLFNLVMLNFPHMDEDHIRSTGGNDHMMNSSDHEIPVTDIMSDGAHTPVVA